MKAAAKKQLLRLILEILAILGALLLGISAGCRMSWTPSRAELELGYPTHAVDVTFTATPKTQPAAPVKP